MYTQYTDCEGVMSGLSDGVSKYWIMQRDFKVEGALDEVDAAYKVLRENSSSDPEILRVRLQQVTLRINAHIRASKEAGEFTE